MIKVTKKNVDNFLVIVDEGNSKTEHNVELDDECCQNLTSGKMTKEELIKKSFDFLLKKEAKESILSGFNLKVIKRYFPEYERVIKEGMA